MLEQALLTIDQLAARVGMTTRNIRAYQARGLLAAPVMRGRRGYYNDEHVERLTLVRRLQDEGMNLATIGRVLLSGGLEQAIVGPFADEAPVEVALDDLVRRLAVPSSERDALAGLAERHGIIERLDGGRVRILQPAVVRGAERLAELGIPLRAMLTALGPITTALESVADEFVEVAQDHLLASLMHDAATDEGIDFAKLEARVSSLKAAATDVVQALVNRTIAERISQVLTEAQASIEPAGRAGTQRV